MAFREAALDEGNPDPTKALLNLGVCFMALNRPVDAVASYESALQFDMVPDIRHKLYANLGQAYVALSLIHIYAARGQGPAWEVRVPFACLVAGDAATRQANVTHRLRLPFR